MKGFETVRRVVLSFPTSFLRQVGDLSLSRGSIRVLKSSLSWIEERQRGVDRSLNGLFRFPLPLYRIKQEEGYSLLEIMIVIVIIGILALIAIPKFTGVTTRAKMTEAKTMLKQVYTLQTAYYFARDVYADSLSAIGFEQRRLASEGGNARYLISMEAADARGFTALATAVVDYDHDGTMNVWEVDEEGMIRQRVPD